MRVRGIRNACHNSCTAAGIEIYTLPIVNHYFSLIFSFDIFFRKWSIPIAFDDDDDDDGDDVTRSLIWVRCSEVRTKYHVHTPMFRLCRPHRPQYPIKIILYVRDHYPADVYTYVTCNYTTPWRVPIYKWRIRLLEVCERMRCDGVPVVSVTREENCQFQYASRLTAKSTIDKQRKKHPKKKVRSKNRKIRKNQTLWR